MVKVLFLLQLPNGRNLWLSFFILMSPKINRVLRDNVRYNHQAVRWIMRNNFGVLNIKGGNIDVHSKFIDEPVHFVILVLHGVEGLDVHLAAVFFVAKRLVIIRVLIIFQRLFELFGSIRELKLFQKLRVVSFGRHGLLLNI